MSEKASSGSTFGIWAIVIVLALIGAGYLYQREGGHLFGENGLLGDKGAGKYITPTVPTVSGIDVSWDTGVLTHDLIFTNNYHGGDLEDVELTLTMYRDDGGKPESKLYWTTWKRGEQKKVNMPSHPYQKAVLKGKAKNRSTEVNVDSEWSWNWKR